MLTRTFYTPGQRAELERQCQGPIGSMKAAMSKTCEIPYPGAETPQSRKYRAEWLLIGRVLGWEVADNCEKAAWDDAIEEELLISKLGFDLTGSTPQDASLGFALIDTGRKAIAPSIDKMDPKHLTVLAEGMKALFQDRPKISRCLETASREMLQDVQNVQDAFQKQDLTWVAAQLGSDAKEPIQYLNDLHAESDTKRAAYFDGFAKEAREDGEFLCREADLSAAERAKLDRPKLAGDRPWKRLARHFFGIGEPILEMNDRTCARTQLLILESEIQIALKTKDSTPPDLGAFTRSLTIDPYSGGPFVYHTDGKDYQLYSVGEDLVDNNGDTDETYSSPDLLLERPR